MAFLGLLFAPAGHARARGSCERGVMWRGADQIHLGDLQDEVGPAQAELADHGILVLHPGRNHLPLWTKNERGNTKK